LQAALQPWQDHDEAGLYQQNSDRLVLPGDEPGKMAESHLFVSFSTVAPFKMEPIARGFLHAGGYALGFLAQFSMGFLNHLTFSGNLTYVQKSLWVKGRARI
jgi:hypothetical protein